MTIQPHPASVGDAGDDIILAGLETVWGLQPGSLAPMRFAHSAFPKRFAIPSEVGVYWWSAPQPRFPIVTSSGPSHSRVMYIGSGTGTEGLKKRVWDQIRWSDGVTAQHQPGWPEILRAVDQFGAELSYVSAPAGLTGKDVQYHEKALIKFYGYALSLPPPFNSGAWETKSASPVYAPLTTMAAGVRIPGIYP